MRKIYLSLFIFLFISSVFSNLQGQGCITPTTAGTLSGNQEICADGYTTFTSTVSGGTWSSSNSSVALVGNIANTTPGAVEWCYIAQNQVSTGVSRIYIDMREFTGTGVSPSEINSIKLLDIYSGPVTFQSSGSDWAIYQVNSSLPIGSSAYSSSIRFMGASPSCACTGEYSFKVEFNFERNKIIGISAGTASITYTVAGTGGCSDATTSRAVTVTAPPNAGTLTGTQTICLPGTTRFTSSVGTSGTLNFYGINNYVKTASNIAALNITGDITLEGWFNIMQLPNDWVMLIGKGDGGTNRTYGFWLSPSGQLLWQIYGSSGIDLFTSTRLQTNTWYHLAATRNGNAMKIYINGIEAASDTYSGTPNSSTSPFQIGYGNVHTYLKGTVDEVRVWNVARTATQLNDNKDREISAQAGLVAYYQFNQGTPNGTNTGITTLIDNSGNSYNGTLTNFGLTGTLSNWTSRPVTAGTWSSSNPAVATVSPNGLVTGISAGTATITFTVTGTGGCTDATATRTVTVAPPPSAGTLSGTQTTFIGATTTFGSTATGGTWTSGNTAVATVSASGVVTGVAAGISTITYTVEGTAGCAAATATRTVSVFACPTIPALSSSAYPVCAEGSFILTAAGLTGMSSLSSGITFKYSTTALANPYVGGTVIATVPFANLEAASTVARTTTSLLAGGTYYIYAILSTTPDGSGCLPYATTTLVVNPKGQVTLPANIVVCNGTSVAAQALSTTNSGGTTTYAWTNSATSIGLAASGISSTIPAFTAVNTGSTGVTATISITPTYTDGGLSCPGPVGTYSITVNPIPALSTVSNQVICAGSTGAVNFNSSAPGTTAQTLSYSSGAINLAIPDASATGVSSALAATIPTGSSITGISVNFNITHTWDSDLTINLVAPNGQVLNLVRSRGGSGDNFTNTTISSASTTSLASGSAPFTGTFAADAVTGVGPTAYASTAANFAALYSGITSGNWRLAVRDGGFGDIGTLNSWSISFTYNPPPSINWTNSNTAIGLGASGVGNINFTALNTTAGQITSTLTATPFYSNEGLTCTGTPVNFTIAVNPAGQVSSVLNQVLCNGAATNAVTFATTNSGVISSGGTQTASSGAISIAIPDASATGVANTIPVTLPAGAVINSMSVNFNITHTWDGDLSINLVAPNGQVLNLVDRRGSLGDNFINTTISPNATTSLASGTAPFTGTFLPDASISQGATGYLSTAANFAALYSVPSGNWRLVIRDHALGDVGTLTGWSLNFNYAVQGTFGTNMNWTNSATSIGLAASGTGHIPSFTATNTGNSPVVSTVSVTPVYFNSGTSCTGSPTTFTYTVNPTPTVNTVAAQTFCAGTPATVSHSGTVSGTVYSWTNSNTAIGLAASGTGNLSFTPTNTGAAPITSTITVTPSFTNAGVTCVGTPKTYTIMVNPVGQVSPVTSQVLCNGSSTTAVSFTTVNGGGTTVAGTQSATSGTISLAIPDGNAAGVVHTIPVSLPAGATVTGVSANFNIAHTWVGDLSINLVAPNGQILNLVNRQGGSGEDFINTTVSPSATATFASGSAPFTGTFLPDAAIGVGATSFASTAANFNALYSTGSGDWKLVIRDHASFDVGTLNNWSLTFNYTTITPAVTTYAWTNNTPGIGLAATGTGNIAAFTASNTTSAPVTATVTVTPTYTNNTVGCAGTPITYTYTVNPTPSVNTIANQTVCRGSSTTAVTITGPVAGTVYTWTSSNAAVGLSPTTGSASIPSFVATNTTAAPIVTTITVTPSYTNGGITCVGTPRSFTITVNPIPTVNAVNSFAVCHNSTAAATFSGATTGTVYNWTNSNTAIGLAASGTGNINFTALNTTSAPVTATITVTPSYTNGGTTCVGTPTSFTITVNPLPVVSAGSLPARICLSDTLVKLNGTPVGGSWSGIGASGEYFIPTATNIGSYVLTYTYADANGCVNRATVTANVQACEERNRDLDNDAVILYPNPNSGQFNLRINSTRFNVLGMRVYNAAGQLVSVNQWSGLVYARVIPVNLTSLAAGTYMVRLYYGDGMDRGADKTYQIIIAR